MIVTTGSHVGHLLVQEQLGAGGLGVVYLAEDLRLKRRVATIPGWIDTVLLPVSNRVPRKP